MAKLLVLVVALCCAQVIYGARIARDAPAAASDTLTFKDIAQQAEEAMGTMQQKFFEFWGVKDGKELGDVVQTQSRSYADKLQELATQLTDEAKQHSGKFDDVVKSLNTKISETITEFQTNNPEMSVQTKKVQETFQTHLRSIMDETEKLADKLKAEGPETSAKLEKVAKEIFDSTLNTAKAVSSKIEEVVKDTPK